MTGQDFDEIEGRQRMTSSQSGEIWSALSALLDLVKLCKKLRSFTSFSARH